MRVKTNLIEKIDQSRSNGLGARLSNGTSMAVYPSPRNVYLVGRENESRQRHDDESGLVPGTLLLIVQNDLFQMIHYVITAFKCNLYSW